MKWHFFVLISSVCLFEFVKSRQKHSISRTIRTFSINKQQYVIPSYLILSPLPILLLLILAYLNKTIKHALNVVTHAKHVGNSSYYWNLLIQNLVGLRYKYQGRAFDPILKLNLIYIKINIIITTKKCTKYDRYS